MLATPHLLTGAAIGKTLRRPWLAWPAAFGSHFLLDDTPHLDSHALFGVAHGGITRAEAMMGIADLLLGIALVTWAVRQRPERRVMLGGAFFAILIDLLHNIEPLGRWFEALPRSTWLWTFHRGFQHNVTPAEWPLGVGTQLITVVIALWVACAWKERHLTFDHDAPLAPSAGR
jgi:hypothetical protein